MENNFDVATEIKKVVKQYEMGFLTVAEVFKRIRAIELSAKE